MICSGRAHRSVHYRKERSGSHQVMSWLIASTVSAKARERDNPSASLGRYRDEGSLNIGGF